MLPGAMVEWKAYAGMKHGALVAFGADHQLVSKNRDAKRKVCLAVGCGKSHDQGNTTDSLILLISRAGLALQTTALLEEGGSSRERLPGIGLHSTGSTVARRALHKQEEDDRPSIEGHKLEAGVVSARRCTLQTRLQPPVHHQIPIRCSQPPTHHLIPIRAL
jgi:hypothetical protein